MDRFTEMIRLAPAVYLQVSPRKFRLYRLHPWEAVPSLETFQEADDPTVTRQAMAGAFYAGLLQQSSSEKIAESSGTPSSLLVYVYFLAGMYHTTHATPPTMRRVAERLASRGQHAAATYCRRVAEEEAGHDTLALMDLSALGLQASEFVARLRPEKALALVELFTRFADSDAPISVLGYGYALERLALFLKEGSIAAIERLIPTGIQATRCLRVHSAVGTDTRHVAEAVAFIATLPPEDRTRIARAAYETACLQFAPNDYPGDIAMRDIVSELTD